MRYPRSSIGHLSGELRTLCVISQNRKESFQIRRPLFPFVNLIPCRLTFRVFNFNFVRDRRIKSNFSMISHQCYKTKMQRTSRAIYLPSYLPLVTHMNFAMIFEVTFLSIFFDVLSCFELSLLSSFMLDLKPSWRAQGQPR